MMLARLRLSVALVLFVAWVGWLGVQAFTRPHDPILSHAQLLVSNLDIIADLSADAEGKPEPVVQVAEVHWPKEGSDLPKPGDRLTVVNLPMCPGFVGPGRYIVALSRKGANYRVAGPPRSPGYEPYGPAAQPRIYPLTAETQRQLDLIAKPAPR